MSSKIFLCFDCGTRNRIEDGRDRAKAKCGKCSAYLFPDAQNTSVAKPSKSYTNKPDSGADKSSGDKTWYVVAAIVAILALVAILGSNNNNSFRNSNLPPSVSQRPGIVSNWTGRQPVAPFEIITERGQNYYVKLVDSSSGRDAVSIYVTGGSRIEVNVPLGAYKIKYAVGSTWRGERHLFGPGNHTQFFAANDEFYFQRRADGIYGYTIELIAQSGGNLHTYQINSNNF